MAMNKLGRSGVPVELTLAQAAHALGWGQAAVSAAVMAGELRMGLSGIIADDVLRLAGSLVRQGRLDLEPRVWEAGPEVGI